MPSKPSKSQNDSGDSSDRQSLPFEPNKNRKKADDKLAPKAAVTAKATPTQRDRTQTARATTGIPDVVSRRMVKRMAFFCGIPTALAISTFLVSYFIIINDIYKIPTYAVLLVSLGWFGLGVLGLSYGALSASWDEERLGGILGWTEFTTNWGRMTGAWKADRESAKKS
ncbi:MAG: DUF3464 family protein [Cyanobacteria bacterium CRU_2_1]|nr:DUF3464 family protein [Hydrococcus sp. RU_2_2]NJR60334.1 DUF3464 family protein [Cyanobacteria bacterium CRU_2_1]